MRRGIDLLAVLGGGPHARPGPCTELAYAYSMLGYILRDRGRLGEAREMGRRSIDRLVVAAARSTDPGPYLPELGSALLRQGRILADLGQDRDAEAAFLRSLEVFEGLTKSHPDDARYRQDCARILHFLGWFCEEHVRYREAERYYVRARDLREHLVEEEAGQNKVIVGTLTIVYDHHRPNLSEKLIAAQHHAASKVLAATHVHLDHHNCLEVVIMKGRSREVRNLGDQILSLRGVKHGRLVITSTGKNLK